MVFWEEGRREEGGGELIAHELLPSRLENMYLYVDNYTSINL